MEKRKLLMVATLAMALTSPLFAQGANESKGSSKVAGPVTINYYTWNDASHQAMVDEFNKTHTDVQVDGHILAAADYETKITTLLSGRADIDAFMEKRPTDIFNQYDNGYLEPLNSYIEKSGGSQAVDNYKSTVSIDKDIVALPWRGGAYFTYYNKSVFEKAGIPTPDTYVKNGTWTWEKFEEVSEAIHKADSSLIGSSIYIWGSNGFFMADQAGDKLIDKDGNVGNLNNVLKQLEMRKRLEDSGSMWKLIDMKVTKTHYSKQFYDGKLGMLIIGEWFPGQMATGEKDGLLNGYTYEDFGITRMPCDVSDYRTSNPSTANSITTYSKKKDAAWEFINWMSGPEGAAIAATYGILPADASDKAVSIISENLPKGNSAQYYLEPKVSQSSNFSMYGTRVEAEFSKLQEDYLLGNLTSKQFMDKFTSVCNEIVKTTY
ncbi:MAG: extracellular solute-binding protein [Spirochaetaceae bacterium]|nr:extracellular solute-binding protein [Spirochaetaceae bacterium]